MTTLILKLKKRVISLIYLTKQKHELRFPWIYSFGREDLPTIQLDLMAIRRRSVVLKPGLQEFQLATNESKKQFLI